MSFQQTLDALPLSVAYALFALLALGCYEAGFRGGRWWQERTLDEKQGPTGMLVGSLLALMAFLLATTMGMASDRFDVRRKLVVTEANAIGSAYLRAGLLPREEAERARGLIRAYVPRRIILTDGRKGLDERLERSRKLQEALWAMSENVMHQPSPPAGAKFFVKSVGELIDVGAERLTANLYARVPETVFWLLIGGAFLTLGMVGYNAGLTRKRGMVTALAMVFMLGAVITLLTDIDRPYRGILKVGQQPLLDLEAQISSRP